MNLPSTLQAAECEKGMDIVLSIERPCILQGFNSMDYFLKVRTAVGLSSQGDLDG